MKKILSFTACMFFIMLSCFAQDKKPVLTFKQTTHDFGTFDEEKGKVTTEFEFTNTGNAPLLIVRTAASCGCTTPEYPKEPIAPGKKGVIKVTYNAKGRPGVFQKTVYVFANTDPEKSTLIIKGHVNAAPPKKEINYPKQIGELRLKSKYIPFFDVYPLSVKTEVIEVYNPTDRIIPVFFSEVPKHIRVVAVPEVIPANKTGKIEVTYMAEKAKDWGLRKDNFKVLLGSARKENPENYIVVSADIREDFSKMSAADQASAPIAQLDNREVNFGNVSAKTTKTINVTNTGKSPLIIRKVKNDHRAFNCEMSKETIQPGKSAQLKITCDTQKATQRNLTNHIVLITNDPKHSNMTVRLQARID
ncbi:MAG: DUF1573 domain-containing protein [Bacteroidales bacterium]